MKKFLFLFIVIIFSGTLTAQYVQPESAIWDNTNKRYYISNAGSGTIVMRDWGGTSHPSWASGLIQPKAMLILDSTLYVLDYTTIKTYNINTARFLKNETVPAATFLNDICMDGDGNFYMTDTYDNSIFKYDRQKDKYTKLQLKGFIEKPNGIICDGNRLVIVSFRPKSPIQAISLQDYKVTTLVETDIDYMDGIAKDGKGNVFISAWIDQNSGSGKVYRMKDDFTGTPEVVISNLDGPADIYYNQLSDTLVIPNMNGNNVQFIPFIDPPPAPNLKKPERGGYFKENNLFEWEKSRAAISYTIQFADNYAFEDSIEVTTLSDTFYRLQLNSDNCDTLYWRVKAVNSKGESPWSESWFLLPPLPIEPKLLSPDDGDVDVATDISFFWNKQFQNYIFVLDTASDFSSSLKIESFTTDTVFINSAGLLPATKYYWTVKGTRCGDTVAGEVRSFTTVDSRSPEKADLISPEDKSKDVALANVEFKWSKTAFTDFSILTIAADSKFKIIKEQDTLTGESQIIHSTLDCSSEYYWKVTTVNNFAETESDVFSFTTIPCTGVDEQNEAVIKIMPQPANSWVRIKLKDNLQHDVRVELINTKGKKYGVSYNIYKNYLKISGIDRLVSGLYLLKITSGKKIYIRKLIISN